MHYKNSKYEEKYKLKSSVKPNPGDIKIDTENFKNELNIHNALNEINASLFMVFQNLEADVLSKMKAKKENRLNSYTFQKSRIEKIGIDNIRQSKLARLNIDHENWIKSFESNQKIIPGIKQLLTIRING